MLPLPQHLESCTETGISQGTGNKSLGRIHGCARLRYSRAVNSMKHPKSHRWRACFARLKNLRSYFLGKFRPVALFALFFGRSLCSVHFSILLDTRCLFRWWIPFHTQASHELQIVSFAASRHFLCFIIIVIIGWLQASRPIGDGVRWRVHYTRVIDEANKATAGLNCSILAGCAFRL